MDWIRLLIGDECFRKPFSEADIKRGRVRSESRYFSKEGVLHKIEKIEGAKKWETLNQTIYAKLHILFIEDEFSENVKSLQLYPAEGVNWTTAFEVGWGGNKIAHADILKYDPFHYEEWYAHQKDCCETIGHCEDCAKDKNTICYVEAQWQKSVSKKPVNGRPLVTKDATDTTLLGIQMDQTSIKDTITFIDLTDDVFLKWVHNPEKYEPTESVVSGKRSLYRKMNSTSCLEEERNEYLAARFFAVERGVARSGSEVDEEVDSIGPSKNSQGVDNSNTTLQNNQGVDNSTTTSENNKGVNNTDYQINKNNQGVDNSTTTSENNKGVNNTDDQVNKKSQGVDTSTTTSENNQGVNNTDGQINKKSQGGDNSTTTSENNQGVINADDQINKRSFRTKKSDEKYVAIPTYRTAEGADIEIHTAIDSTTIIALSTMDTNGEEDYLSQIIEDEMNIPRFVTIAADEGTRGKAEDFGNSEIELTTHSALARETESFHESHSTIEKKSIDINIGEDSNTTEKMSNVTSSKYSGAVGISKESTEIIRKRTPSIDEVALDAIYPPQTQAPGQYCSSESSSTTFISSEGDGVSTAVVSETDELRANILQSTGIDVNGKLTQITSEEKESSIITADLIIDTTLSVEYESMNVSGNFKSTLSSPNASSEETDLSRERTMMSSAVPTGRISYDVIQTIVSESSEWPSSSEPNLEKTGVPNDVTDATRKGAPTHYNVSGDAEHSTSRHVSASFSSSDSRYTMHTILNGDDVVIEATSETDVNMTHTAGIFSRTITSMTWTEGTELKNNSPATTMISVENGLTDESDKFHFTSISSNSSGKNTISSSAALTGVTSYDTRRSVVSESSEWPSSSESTLDETGGSNVFTSSTGKGTPPHFEVSVEAEHPTSTQVSMSSCCSESGNETIFTMPNEKDNVITEARSETDIDMTHTAEIIRRTITSMTWTGETELENDSTATTMLSVDFGHTGESSRFRSTSTTSNESEKSTSLSSAAPTGRTSYDNTQSVVSELSEWPSSSEPTSEKTVVSNGVTGSIRKGTPQRAVSVDATHSTFTQVSASSSSSESRYTIHTIPNEGYEVITEATSETDVNMTHTAGIVSRTITSMTWTEGTELKNNSPATTMISVENGLTDESAKFNFTSTASNSSGEKTISSSGSLTGGTSYDTRRSVVSESSEWPSSSKPTLDETDVSKLFTSSTGKGTPPHYKVSVGAEHPTSTQVSVSSCCSESSNKTNLTMPNEKDNVITEARSETDIDMTHTAEIIRGTITWTDETELENDSTATTMLSVDFGHTGESSRFHSTSTTSNESEKRTSLSSEAPTGRTSYDTTESVVSELSEWPSSSEPRYTIHTIPNQGYDVITEATSKTNVNMTHTAGIINEIVTSTASTEETDLENESTVTALLSFEYDLTHESGRFHSNSTTPNLSRKRTILSSAAPTEITSYDTIQIILSESSEWPSSSEPNSEMLGVPNEVTDTTRKGTTQSVVSELSEWPSSSEATSEKTDVPDKTLNVVRNGTSQPDGVGVDTIHSTSTQVSVSTSVSESSDTILISRNEEQDIVTEATSVDGSYTIDSEKYEVIKVFEGINSTLSSISLPSKETDSGSTTLGGANMYLMFSEESEEAEKLNTIEFTSRISAGSNEETTLGGELIDTTESVESVSTPGISRESTYSMPFTAGELSADSRTSESISRRLIESTEETGTNSEVTMGSISIDAMSTRELVHSSLYTSVTPVMTSQRREFISDEKTTAIKIIDSGLPEKEDATISDSIKSTPENTEISSEQNGFSDKPARSFMSDSTLDHSISSGNGIESIASVRTERLPGNSVSNSTIFISSSEKIEFKSETSITIKGIIIDGTFSEETEATGGAVSPEFVPTDITTLTEFKEIEFGSHVREKLGESESASTDPMISSKGTYSFAEYSSAGDDLNTRTMPHTDIKLTSEFYTPDYPTRRETSRKNIEFKSDDNVSTREISLHTMPFTESEVIEASRSTSEADFTEESGSYEFFHEILTKSKPKPGSAVTEKVSRSNSAFTNLIPSSKKPELSTESVIGSTSEITFPESTGTLKTSSETTQLNSDNGIPTGDITGHSKFGTEYEAIKISRSYESSTAIFSTLQEETIDKSETSTGTSGNDFRKLENTEEFGSFEFAITKSIISSGGTGLETESSTRTNSTNAMPSEKIKEIEITEKVSTTMLETSRKITQRNSDDSVSNEDISTLTIPSVESEVSKKYGSHASTSTTQLPFSDETKSITGATTGRDRNYTVDYIDTKVSNIFEFSSTTDDSNAYDSDSTNLPSSSGTEFTTSLDFEFDDISTKIESTSKFYIPESSVTLDISSENVESNSVNGDISIHTKFRTEYEAPKISRSYEYTPTISLTSHEKADDEGETSTKTSANASEKLKVIKNFVSFEYAPTKSIISSGDTELNTESSSRTNITDSMSSEEIEENRITRRFTGHVSTTRVDDVDTENELYNLVSTATLETSSETVDLNSDDGIALEGISIHTKFRSEYEATKISRSYEYTATTPLTFHGKIDDESGASEETSSDTSRKLKVTEEFGSSEFAPSEPIISSRKTELNTESNGRTSLISTMPSEETMITGEFNSPEFSTMLQISRGIIGINSDDRDPIEDSILTTPSVEINVPEKTEDHEFTYATLLASSDETESITETTTVAATVGDRNSTLDDIDIKVSNMFEFSHTTHTTSNEGIEAENEVTEESNAYDFASTNLLTSVQRTESNTESSTGADDINTKIESTSKSFIPEPTATMETSRGTFELNSNNGIPARDITIRTKFSTDYETIKKSRSYKSSTTTLVISNGETIDEGVGSTRTSSKFEQIGDSESTSTNPITWSKGTECNSEPSDGNSFTESISSQEFEIIEEMIGLESTTMMQTSRKILVSNGDYSVAAENINTRSIPSTKVSEKFEDPESSSTTLFTASDEIELITEASTRTTPDGDRKNYTSFYMEMHVFNKNESTPSTTILSIEETSLDDKTWAPTEEMNTDATQSIESEVIEKSDSYKPTPMTLILSNTVTKSGSEASSTLDDHNTDSLHITESKINEIFKSSPFRTTSGERDQFGNDAGASIGEINIDSSQSIGRDGKVDHSHITLVILQTDINKGASEKTWSIDFIEQVSTISGRSEPTSATDSTESTDIDIRSTQTISEIIDSIPLALNDTDELDASTEYEVYVSSENDIDLISDTEKTSSVTFLTPDTISTTSFTSNHTSAFMNDDNINAGIKSTLAISTIGKGVNDNNNSGILLGKEGDITTTNEPYVDSKINSLEIHVDADIYHGYKTVYDDGFNTGSRPEPSTEIFESSSFRTTSGGRDQFGNDAGASIEEINEDSSQSIGKDGKVDHSHITLETFQTDINKGAFETTGSIDFIEQVSTIFGRSEPTSATDSTESTDIDTRSTQTISEMIDPISLALNDTDELNASTEYEVYVSSEDDIDGTISDIEKTSSVTFLTPDTISTTSFTSNHTSAFMNDDNVDVGVKSTSAISKVEVGVNDNNNSGIMLGSEADITTTNEPHIDSKINTLEIHLDTDIYHGHKTVYDDGINTGSRPEPSSEIFKYSSSRITSGERDQFGNDAGASIEEINIDSSQGIDKDGKVDHSHITLGIFQTDINKGAFETTGSIDFIEQVSTISGRSEPTSATDSTESTDIDIRSTQTISEIIDSIPLALNDTDELDASTEYEVYVSSENDIDGLISDTEKTSSVTFLTPDTISTTSFTSNHTSAFMNDVNVNAGIKSTLAISTVEVGVNVNNNSGIPLENEADITTTNEPHVDSEINSLEIHVDTDIYHEHKTVYDDGFNNGSRPEPSTDFEIGTLSSDTSYKNDNKSISHEIVTDTDANLFEVNLSTEFETSVSAAESTDKTMDIRSRVSSISSTDFTTGIETYSTIEHQPDIESSVTDVGGDIVLSTDNSTSDDDRNIQIKVKN